MKQKYMLGSVAVILLLYLAPQLLAQEANPTPPVIQLTATAMPTTTPEPQSGVQPDIWEPNDDPAHAALLGWGTVTNLSLHEGDVDYFTLYLKAGQYVTLATTSPDYLDTLLQVWQGERLLAANDDRTASDLTSAVLLTAPVEGWYLVQVGNAALSEGTYALQVALIEPTATTIPTQTPTATPMPTVLPTVTPPFVEPTVTPAVPSLPIFTAVSTPLPRVTTTLTTISETAVYTLTLTRLHTAQPTATPAVTTAQVLIYYDANNNRQPEPGEGIANVSVLVVDGQGQQVARAFTNPQGEAAFTLNDADVARVLVPFVSSWSARLRPGQRNEEIILGLPAVRLPVFLPVAEGEAQ